MARRHTKNTVTSVDEVHGLFHGLGPGVAKRMRCGMCELDVRYTRDSFVTWFLNHTCGDSAAPPVPPQTQERGVATVQPRSISVTGSEQTKPCPCCGERIADEEQFRHLDQLMRHNGDYDAWGHHRRVAVAA
jgi:hypothetical protein